MTTALAMPYVPPPRRLGAFPNARRVKPIDGRYRWRDDTYIYEWDRQHGRVEKYTKRGHHIGEFDAVTGKQTGPRIADRRIKV